MKEILEKIYKQWLIATNKAIDDNLIRMGLESDWLVHRANEYLEKDSTGLLTVITLISAFKIFCKEHSWTVEEVLNNTHLNELKELKKLKDLLFKDDVGNLYYSFINQIITNGKSLGKYWEVKDLEKMNNFEKILTDAIIDFNNTYKLHHERFNDGELKYNPKVKILYKLFQFNSLEDFVRALKESKEKDFICVSLINRTYNEIQDEYYDNNYDSFFAYGINNNGVVYVSSDRVIFDSPEGLFKTRNPARQFNNKLDFSHLPYNDLNELKDDKTLRLSYNVFNDNKIEDSFANQFDDEALIYSIVIISLIIKKYFIDIIDNSKRMYFSDEVKLIPNQTECKALVLKDNLQIKTMNPKEVRASDINSEQIYNHGFYDYYIDLYCKDLNETKLPSNFIIDINRAQELAWWSARKAQVKCIQTCLDESFEDKEKDIDLWFYNKVIENIDSIIKFMLTNESKDMLSNYKFYDESKDSIPLWKRIVNGEDLLLYKLTKELDTRYPFNSKYFREYDLKNSDIGKLIIPIGCYNSRYSVEIALANNSVTNKVSITLVLRSYYDLQYFFNLKNEELPFELRRVVRNIEGYKPYGGNPILNFTDPMNSLVNPFEKKEYSITLNLPKSIYNKLSKLYNK